MTTSSKPTSLGARLWGTSEAREAKALACALDAESQSLQDLYSGKAREAKRVLKGVAFRAPRHATLIKLASLYAAQGRDEKATKTLQRLRPASAPAKPEQLADFVAFAVQNDLRMTRVLLAQGGSVHRVDAANGHPLALALRHARYEIAQELLRRGATATDLPDFDKSLCELEHAGEHILQRSLLATLSAGHRQELLIPQLASGHPRAASLLLDLGASVKDDGEEGAKVVRTALQRIDTQGMLSLLERIMAGGARAESLGQITAALGKPVAGVLLTQLHKQWGTYAALPADRQQGLAQLLLAALLRGDKKIRDQLLNYGVPVDGGRSRADAPLDVALACKAWDSVTKLLDKGADIQRFDAGLARLKEAHDNPDIWKRMHAALLSNMLPHDRALWAWAVEVLPTQTYLQWLAQGVAARTQAELERVEQKLAHALSASTPVQQEILTRARASSAKASQGATQALIARAKRLGYSAGDVNTLRTYLMDKAPLTINFPAEHATKLARDLTYKNQFMTHTSSGTLDYKNGGARDRWERNLFGFQAYPGQQVVANDRPRYGHVNAMKVRAGTSQYGSATLVLRDTLRKQVTVTPWDSGNASAKDLGTLSHGIDHVLLNYHEAWFRKAMAISQGGRESRLHTSPTDGGCQYIEMQLHTPMLLRQGVVKKVVVQRKHTAVSHLGDLQRLAERTQARFTWHGATRLGATHRDEALATMHGHGWEVQAWTYAGKYDYYGYAKFNADAAVTHQFVDAPTSARTGTLDMLGETGLQVVGFVANPRRQTDHFLAKAPASGSQGLMHYLVSTGASPLKLAQEQERNGYTLRAVASTETSGTYQVVLGRPIEGAMPVTHGMVASKSSLMNFDERFDNAFSHGKQRGTVAALYPADDKMNTIDVYYFNRAKY